MCGGVAFRYKNIKESELKKYYSKELIERFKETGKVESFFWQKQAVLPIETKDGLELKEWGNKDKDLKLPKTGWAKSESIDAGKWDYLHPELVNIAVDSGYEKKTWFDFKKGSKGILIKKDKLEKVYLITKAAEKDYEEKTGHEREPLGEKGEYRKAIDEK